VSENAELIDCDSWLQFIEHELERGQIKSFPLSEVELRRLVAGWKALRGFDAAAAARKIEAVRKALQ
jgi:hypothetical protein